MQAETSEQAPDSIDDTAHSLSGMKIQEDMTVCIPGGLPELAMHSDSVACGFLVGMHPSKVSLLHHACMSCFTVWISVVVPPANNFCITG